MVSANLLVIKLNFIAHIKKRTLINKEKFTTYRNKFKTLKKKAEKDYYDLLNL